MSKLYDLQELVDHTGLPERTVRYYLAKVLEAPGGTRGRKAFYPQETLDQLKLAKHILMGPYDSKRGEVKPSLRDFQHWLKGHSAEEISMMAEMPYRIKPKALLAASAPQASVVRDDTSHYFAESTEPDSGRYGEEDKEKTKDTAAQYLSRVMQTDREPTLRPGKQKTQATPWEDFQFGDKLIIKVRERLTPAQKRQLALAGQLLQSMLEKE